MDKNKDENFISQWNGFINNIVNLCDRQIKRKKEEFPAFEILEPLPNLLKKQILSEKSKAVFSQVLAKNEKFIITILERELCFFNQLVININLEDEMQVKKCLQIGDTIKGSIEKFLKWTLLKKALHILNELLSILRF